MTLVWFVALFVMFFRGSPQIPRKYVVLVGVTTVLVAKSAFGRYDTIHFAALLGLMVVAMAVGVCSKYFLGQPSSSSSPSS